MAPIYRETLDLYARVKSSDLDAEAKAGLELELGAKIEQFQEALKDLLGLDLIAFTGRQWEGRADPGGRGGSADEMPRSVTRGEEFGVRVHLAKALGDVRLSRVWLESRRWRAVEDRGRKWSDRHEIDAGLRRRR